MDTGATTEKLSETLDAIFTARTVLAEESFTVDALLKFNSFPKSRVLFALAGRKRMRAAAAGDVALAYAGQAYLARALARVGGVEVESWQVDDIYLRSALVELNGLRGAAAYEIGVMTAHAHGSRFPKGAAKLIDDAVGRLTRVARGSKVIALRGEHTRPVGDDALLKVGAPTTLTVYGHKTRVDEFRKPRTTAS